MGVIKFSLDMYHRYVHKNDNQPSAQLVPYNTNAVSNFPIISFVELDPQNNRKVTVGHRAACPGWRRETVEPWRTGRP